MMHNMTLINSHYVSLWVLGTIAVIFLGFVLLVLLPYLIVGRNLDPPKSDLLKARNDIRTAGIQILGGAVLLGGLLFTNRTLALNQQGQITDRFTKATDQLGSDKLDIRLGGIYSLERIARDSKADQGPVMEVLTAFVRYPAAGAPTNTVSPVGSSTTTTATPMVPTDIQAVLTVVGRRKASNDPQGYRVDLRYSNLLMAYLSRAYLARAYLNGADLSHADLSHANLSGADLSGAHLNGADLSHADLTGADLLSRANVSGANLTGANVSRADLTGADFHKADLTHADLTGAYLTGADLSGALNLTQDQVDSAFTDEATKLPAGRKPSPRKP
jgi:hypothetical protein